MYRDLTEFDRSPKLTATSMFWQQQIPENYFQLHETPKNGSFGGGMEISFVKLSYVRYVMGYLIWKVSVPKQK